MNRNSIKMTILGGFLGSGKTTVLNTIIKNLPEGKKTALLINDFGDINIDALLIEKGNYSKKDIRGGCICCSLKEQLLQSLLTIVNEEKPDQIYIEATGLAVPWEMKKSVDTNFQSNIIKVDEVLVCTDALQFNKYHDYLPAYSRQFEGQPYVLLTKAEIHDSYVLTQIKKKLKQHYPGIQGISESVKGNWHRRGDTQTGEETLPTPLLPLLLDIKMIDTGKDGIEQLTVQGNLKGSLEDLKSIILENREKIIRLKAIIPVEYGLESIQLAADQLSHETLKNRTDEIPKSSYLSLFSTKEDLSEMKKVFSYLFKE